MSTDAPSSPRDQQWLHEVCELVKNKMPESHSFVVFAFPHTGTDRCYYSSNAQRASVIAALMEWLEYQRRVEVWMTHDDGPPPKHPAVLAATVEKHLPHLRMMATHPTPSVLRIREMLHDFEEALK